MKQNKLALLVVLVSLLVGCGGHGGGPSFGGGGGGPTVTKETLTAAAYGDVVVNAGGILTLDPGVYSFNSLTVNGGTIICQGGTVVIYLNGDVNMAGAFTITTYQNKASNLLLLGTANCTTVSINGPGAALYAGLYAPAALVTTSNVTIDGAVQGGTVTGGKNTVINYDPTLATVSYPGIGKVSARSIVEYGVH